MSEIFSFISKIEDQDFLDYFSDESRSLYDKCADLEADCKKRPDTCIREGRALSEQVMKYLYFRLSGCEWTGSAYELLKDNSFQNKVNNSTLIDMAHRIRTDGNAQVHAGGTSHSAIDILQVSKNILSHLPYVIQKSYEIIRRADERTQIKEKAGTKRNHNQNKKTGKQPPVSNNIKKENADHESLADTKTAENADHESLADTKTADTDKNKLADGMKKTVLKEECALTLPYAAGRIQTEVTDIFTSVSSVHYFIRPNDYFALNSLELVTADVYLYRLLKNSRFEYVYFVETEGTGCAVYTYDGPSEMAFAQITASRNVKTASAVKNSTRQDQNELLAENSMNHNSTRMYGRRKICRFSMDENDRMKFASAVKTALDDKEHKTAAVMPLGIFGKDGYCTDAVIDTFSSIVKYNGTDNILLLTMTGRSSLCGCFTGKQIQLHDWAGQVLDETGPFTAYDKQSAAADMLVKCGRLVIADEYGTDEFANLLFRKILIEGNKKLAGIGSAKVYALAESLRDYMMNKYTDQTYRTLKKITGNVIGELNRQLDKETVIQELVKKAGQLSSVRIGYTDQLHSLQIERVYHNYCERYKNENELQEILAKAGQFAGKEMQEIFTQIQETARVWSEERTRIQADQKAGKPADQMPYMNMVFLGNPGTGKTAAARLAARYMKAAGALPFHRFEYISAADINGTGVKTAAKIRESAQRAAGGVLMIDEFQRFDDICYGGNTAREVMGMLAAVTDEYQEDLCIILAGHQEGTFRILSADAVAKRRFPNWLVFRNYSVETLLLILEDHLKRRGRVMEEDAKELVKIVIQKHQQDAENSFGNAGYIKDELLPMLERKRLKRNETDQRYIRQDVARAFADILGPKGEQQIFRPQSIQKAQMEKIPLPYPLAAKESDELQKETDSSVLYITTENGQGTAFLIHPDGYALTCCHVVRDAQEIKARVRIRGRAGGDDSIHNCVLVNAREDLDLAVLKLEGCNFPYLPLARKEREIKKGERFLLSGYPFGALMSQGLTTFQGNIAASGEHRSRAQSVRYLLNSEAKSGNSGSPVIAMADGLVIGILCSSVDGSFSPGKTEEINLMCPAYYFWEELVT